MKGICTCSNACPDGMNFVALATRQKISQLSHLFIIFKQNWSTFENRDIFLVDNFTYQKWKFKIRTDQILNLVQFSKLSVKSDRRYFLFHFYPQIMSKFSWTCLSIAAAPSSSSTSATRNSPWLWKGWNWHWETHPLVIFRSHNQHKKGKFFAGLFFNKLFH